MKTDSAMVNAFVPGAVELSAQETAMVEKRQKLLGPAYRLMYAHPINIVRGEGVWLYDDEGNAFLDAYNNVASVGHCHPHVVEAQTKQAATLATNTRYLHPGILAYAERLLATFPSALSQAMFTCTGSESNDLAMRIATSVTGGTGIIVTECAYHGLTQAVAAFSPSLGANVDLGPHVRVVPAPNAYRRNVTDIGAQFKADVEAALADLNRHGIKPAALILDTIFSSDGVLPGPAGFLKAAVDAVQAAGALFIADEVQPGFGRTGEHMWGFQRHGVIPDIVTMGKPMGNGYPIAGIVIKPELVAEFGAKARYFNTFGGNTVAIATATAVLDVIENENLRANATEIGTYLRDNIARITKGHPFVGEIRQAGLFLGLEIVKDPATKVADAARATHIINGLRDRRILISGSGIEANVLKIRPPLVFSKSNADHFLAQFLETLSDLD